VHRLRHPIRSITEPYGKAGLLVAILALVLATTGAAFAAAGLNSKQKKEVTKIAKKYAGKNGAPGATGPAGTNGTNGTNGKDGAPGAPGVGGKSVVVGSASGAECPESTPAGGATVEVEGEPSTQEAICNGKEGSPWTDGGTLPPGATETGVFADSFPANISGTDSGGDSFEAPVGGQLKLPIPFTIPLSSPIEFLNTHVVTKEQQETETVPAQCDSDDDGVGSAADPQADPGNLCVFIGQAAENLSFGPLALNPAGGLGASKTGAYLLANTEGAGNLVGTWAVTAEE
jgi:hypothetical protein